MNKGEPAKLATAARIRDEEHLERIFSHDASSAMTLLRLGIAFMRGGVNISAGYRGSVASGACQLAQSQQRTAA